MATESGRAKQAIRVLACATRMLPPLCFLLLAPEQATAAAEQATAAAETWRLGEALKLPERLTLSGDFRARYEYLDSQFRAGTPGDDQILVLRTRVRAGLRITDWLSLAAEFQDSRAYLEDDNTPLGTGTVNAAELLRAYLELSFAGPLGGSHNVQIGRLTMNHGSRRLLARNRFRNTSNAFTGLEWRWLNKWGGELRALYTLPIQRLPSDRAAQAKNVVQFDEEDSDQQFWGLFYTDELPWGDRGELYLYGLHEKGVSDPSEPDLSVKPYLFTPGFRILRKPREGHFDYQFETALQAGNARVSGTNVEALNAFAHFHHLSIGYTFAAPWSPRLILHYDYASGDEDPTDSHWERFDTLYGARRFEYGPTGIYGAFSRSNINTPGLRLRLKPGKHWSAFADYRAVWLASDRDEWVGTGVQDPTGQSGSFVGQQIEMRVRWEALPSNLRLEFGYAHLFAGQFIDNAPNSNKEGDTNYVYCDLQLWF